MYFWVNQGKTYKEEKEGGYLWAPTKNKSGHTVFHWETMKKLKPYDVVFNYCKGKIVGYCVVRSNYYLENQPSEFNVDVEWENEGYMVDTDYFDLEPKSATALYYEIDHLLPEKHGPINTTNKNGQLSVKANQGYLYELSTELGEAISAFCKTPNLETEYRYEDIEEEKIEEPSKTTRRGLVTSRIGQGKYRRKVLNRWRNQCAVTGSKSKEILIASHIVPWRNATNAERTDVHNGLLLSPVYDALFDRHLISFADDGKIVLSKTLKPAEYDKLGISGIERINGLSAENKAYLARHRDKLNR